MSVREQIMDLFLGRRKVTVIHFKYWKSEKIIAIIIMVNLVSCMFILCTSFHLNESWDFGTIISPILHMKTLKLEK